MFIGPVFSREVAIAPRRVKMYVGRTTYVLALLVLISTAWLVLTGTQLVSDVGDLARFGADGVSDSGPAATGPGRLLFRVCWRPAKWPTKRTATRWSCYC